MVIYLWLSWLRIGNGVRTWPAIVAGIGNGCVGAGVEVYALRMAVA
jgi:hypothetical protein